MKIELIEKREVTLEGVSATYYTMVDGSSVWGSFTSDRDEAKALYMLVVENRGVLDTLTTIHETEVSDV